ncbi:phenylacetate--CoA ligase family protein [Shewanella gelidii]|uniref:Phenylacetate--CoA ligase n=1 Tax=Shewanella gelidii TaxID=1642821 RepID=A0A917JT25_9GAMM|nr:AMP-binding protein [Shewanella gelidii]MCL1098453.1 AMP-binding protein [Shewanella gelidii]GGI82633.1 phenylacetate--CoA ligase [Shewanella gelidii]
MSDFFDLRENQDTHCRELDLMARLGGLLSYAKQESAYYRDLLAHFDPTQIRNREDLALLPITRKSDLIAMQKAMPPFAGINSDSGKIERIFQSPGPIYDPENTTQDWWRMGRAFHAAGFRSGDMVQNCLSYHLTPGGFIMDSGARACGCMVIPAGPGQTEQQLDLLEDLKPQGYCGTPSFLKILLDKAKEQQRDVSSLTKALVTGEALFPAVRQQFKEAGIATLQAYATADLGLIAYETIADQGLVVAEDIIVEIVRPGSLQPVAVGEIGEVVVTSLNLDYPLIRFATGDLSSVLTEASPCGRTNMRIRGWQGRADQTTKIKGMFVHPEQVEKVRLAHPEMAKVRLEVASSNHQDVMTLKCESSTILEAPQKLAVQQTLKAVTKLNGDVQSFEIGELPNDGLVIQDLRQSSS